VTRTRLHFLTVLPAAAVILLPAPSVGAPQIRNPKSKIKNQKISFVNDVVPVFTRAGCNAGTCHGAAAGKNGFRLTFRGFAPELDYFFLTRQIGGRRINKGEPEKSLLLRKPLMELPHMGGKVLAVGTPEYEVLRRWLAEGAKGPSEKDAKLTSISVLPPQRMLSPKGKVQLKVIARFSDGTDRDVTHWTRFGTNDENVATTSGDGAVQMTGEGETSIFASYQDKVAIATVAVPFANRVDATAYARLPRSGFIDDLVYTKLKQLRLWPSPAASDTVFARRVYLDLIGTLPTPDEVRAFAQSKDPKKREKLVDALFARNEYTDFWTYKWSDLLRVNRGTMKDKGVWAYHAYIRDAVQNDKPWDVMAREILTSTGNTFLDGPANYFRTALTPEELAENVSQGFLGIRVTCARCHNHPLEKWTQNEYYGMAQLFARVKFKADLGIYVNDEMTVYNARTGDIIQPRLGKPVPPKPLGGPQFSLTGTKDRRKLFVDWLTKADNPFFARVMVNRLWKHFMGRGLVEQVDDLRDTNPPSNPELLDALQKDFVRNGFDLRHTMRQIVLSQAYQRSSDPEPRNAQDTKYYSRYLVKRLTAEQLLDALCQVTGQPEQFPGMPPGFRAIQLPDTQVKSDFMDSFGRPARQITCECERSQEPSMAQALLFINGELINRKVSADGALVDRLLKEGKSDPEIMETLYWTALGRAPFASERERNHVALKKAYAVARHTVRTASTATHVPTYAPDPTVRRRALEDLLWVLVNSKEFLFNH
jgi:hypothetical protein